MLVCMNLKTFLSNLSADERDDFARRCETSYPHLRNISYGQKTCGEKLAVMIERESKGAVTRRDLRPDDWHLIWPELVNDEFPAPTSSETNDTEKAA